MLTLQQLCLQRGQISVFQNYSLSLTGTRNCIIGANGSGKSSLLAAVAGLIPYQGQISWQGAPLSLPRQQIALASDSIIFPEFLTATDLINLQQKMWCTATPAALIERFAFAPQLGKTVASLSTGNHKKLQLILAFMRQPDLLLLDEPNIALDTAACTALFALISQYAGHIVVATNEPERFAKQQFTLTSLQHV
ncbi:hypothetical protein GCM10010919_01460 [Alishewanella longhuensis]|uniref:AAA+ ATPase domain-containing protein n=1 Tax=Alishewanella longhuensis TaxID=1091037 RepID=A0ABQ3KXQ2_9ALTE|nr:ATP-binding cassette domain-containing protein [Alishewanella longhuensis]GHG59155.1 hypothetical protein GCM10010919_01460 [Alishewanella longhuensis]